MNPAYRPSPADDNTGIVFVYRMSFNHLIVMEMMQLA
jgi:hypothetical protein